MRFDVIVEKMRLAALLAQQAGRSFMISAYSSPVLRWMHGRSASGKLLIAPQDLRTIDPTRASELMSGRFSLGGKTIDIGDTSPFAISPPSVAWNEALFGFSWLRHLRAADRSDGSVTARRMVMQYLKDRTRYSAESLDVATAARRLLSLLCQAPLVLEGADRSQYLAFVRALSWHAQYLMAVGPLARDGVPRLMAALAATQASLCLDGATALQKKAARRLARELDRQILADGGHVGRNPQTILDLLLDLLPLRQSYAARGLTPPPQLMGVIDRMMPMTRFFRHSDGSLAAFNGMGYTQTHLVATLRTYDDVRGKPVRQATQSGYQRVEVQDVVLLVDTGAPPPANFSHEAHAGTLSFEFSADNCRIVVNCGAPGIGRESWRQLARSTAAHSTVAVAGASSSHFAPDGWVAAFLGRPIIKGPEQITVERHESSDLTTLRTRHDGYLADHDLIHERDIALSSDGDALFGWDRLLNAKGASYRGRSAAAIRFHLHPAVTATLSDSLDTVSLRLPSGRLWTFHAGGRPIIVTESVYFANPDGSRSTTQLLIEVSNGRGDYIGEVAWTFQRLHG